jgi:steroid delta-isomerase-like uncharacterized protein
VSSQNVETVREVVEILGRGDRLDELDQYFTDDYVRHGGSRDYTLEEFKDILRDLHTGFPELHSHGFAVIADGDEVAYRWTSTGTHSGPYLGVIATAREAVAKGITMTRFRDGKICEEWASWNEVSVLHDLGVFPLRR